MRTIVLTLILGLITTFLAAQSVDFKEWHDQEPHSDAGHPCISAEQYLEMEQLILENREKLKSILSAAGNKKTVQLSWPMRIANGLDDCGYHYISAYVDQDKTMGKVKDWNCGSKTYDGHRGVDIVPWPFIWDKMDHNQIEIIAAAPGTIITKVDGNYDRVCASKGTEPNNYIVVQHSDGSTALYVHLKTGAMTAKGVGDAVLAGEFLGIVGSAGMANGVHLHFELRTDGSFNSYFDPFAGSCNADISSTWWQTQPEYKNPEVLKASIHSNWPYFAVCPITTDTLNVQDSFIVGTKKSAIFHACTKDVETGMTWNFQILNPDNSVFDSWDYTSLSPRTNSIIGWRKNLPTTAGNYKYTVKFNDKLCVKDFTIQSPTGLPTIGQSAIKLYPNPNKGDFQLVLNSIDFSLGISPTFSVYNNLGQRIFMQTIESQTTNVRLNYPSGIYYYQICQGSKLSNVGQFMVED